MQSHCRGRVEIGRQARLRIWCREAYGFDSLRPHSKVETHDLSLYFCFWQMPKNVQAKGIFDFSTPVSCRWQPLLGACRLPLRSSRASPLLRFSAKILLTRMTRRWSAFATLKIIFLYAWQFCKCLYLCASIYGDITPHFYQVSISQIGTWFSLKEVSRGVIV